MQIAVWQIVVITLLAFIYRVDRLGTQVCGHNAVLYAWLVGLILGDGMTGLIVGASVQLMSLGVAALAGSSVPDYPLAGMVGTAVCIMTGQDEGVGLAVGTMGVQLDVLAKTANVFMAHKQLEYAQDGQYEKMKAVTLVGPVLFGLTDAIPMLIVLAFGGDVVNAILSVVPAWFTKGLSLAGGLLPVIGMGALLTYMPAKQYFSFLAIGFVLSAYLGLSILPVAILGGAAAYEVYKNLTSRIAEESIATAEGGLEDE
ncbi:PTS sugar transporter subunit IIC [Olsenella sp. AM39-30AC]|uniref:PTS mannose/fructose/sorbose/N-acetylgalactosamine transporter subunit IIC n=1 Tax=Olsenella sp. AM39-30AC TaxID=2292360 RepID=UPI000E4E66E7|nr:PTS sugar transporter subunit IIC [Olsenella sp. AM39-30AC]RHB56416.1 PTS sugar transporter subunit IIC [Olsenella sp. AM39-30AC]